MKRKDRRNIVKKIQAMKPNQQAIAIQAFEVEGFTFDVAMSSLLDGTPISDIDGASNVYTTYSSQVRNTERKYNGKEQYGNTLVRAVIDTRTSFISGEGLSIAGKDLSDGHKELFEKFLENNLLNSSRLFNLTKRLEIVGKALTMVKKGKDKDLIPMFGVYNSNDFISNPVNPFFPEMGYKFAKTEGNEQVPLNISNATLIVTGGLGYTCNEFTTKVGLVLTDCDNYDRALKNIRELNYNAARITPTFETKSKSETDQLASWLTSRKWKRGDTFAGTAKLTYQSPQTGAIDNLKSELSSTLKSVSAVTGVPVHWLGWVDMMSNRATAEELYQAVYNATIMERTAIAQAFKQILIDVQRVHIDTGGKLIKEINEDIEVSLPLIDLGRFKDMVDAYSKLYLDGAISLETYRNMMPGVDPLLEEKIDEQQLKDDVNKLDQDSLLEEPEESDENEENEE